MIFILLRVSGQAFEPNEIVERFQVPNCHTWCKGDAFQSGRGRTHEDFGFSFSLPNESSWPAALPVIRSMLAKFSALFSAVAAMNLLSELSVGITVGDNASFAPSLDIPLDFMTELLEAKLHLTITAYPTSDEYEQN
jgi:hypothetical protein